jgi:phosphopentomutase
MIEKNNLLILERSAGNLKLDKENSGEYILKGIFGEIDVKNKNNRIYTESEYVPQIKALQDKIKSSKLLGELDHPANFDISLKNVSHIIEELTYDEKTKQVK